MKNLIVIPYGTPKWGLKSENMKHVLDNTKNTEVVYMLPMWGLIEAKKLFPAMLHSYTQIHENTLINNTAIMIRSWLFHHGDSYDKIILLSYGQGRKYWNKGALKTPVVSKVKIVRYMPQANIVLRRRITKALNEKTKK